MGIMIGGCVPVIAEGDSITIGSGFSSYATQYKPNKNSRYSVQIPAVSGSSVSTVSSRGTADDLFAANLPQSIYTCLVGINDFIGGITTSNFLSSYATMLDARRLVYKKVVVCTILPSTWPNVGGTSFSSWRATCNTTISSWVGVHCDAIVDFAADPTMGPDAAASNTSLYSDGTHPTTSSSATLETIYRSVVNGLYT